MKKRLRLLLLLLVPLAAFGQLNTDRATEAGRNALYFADHALAISYFNQVIDAKPYLAEPYYLRAIAKFNLDDYIGALADATKAAEINPFLPDAWEVKGVANQCLERMPDAIADYDRALALLPHNRNILFNKALAQEQAELFADADSTYAELLANYPRFADAYIGRAQLALAQGDTLRARADLDQALTHDDNSVGALTLRAAITANDDPAAALADMEQAVRLQPDRAGLRVNRAVARYNVHDLNGALDDLDYVLALDPLNAAALFNRALLRMELKDNDRALLDLDRLLRLNPADLRSRYNRALVLADKGLYDLALEDADAIVAAQPQMFAAYALRGQIYRDAGRDDEARRNFKTANDIAHRPAEGEGAPDALAQQPTDSVASEEQTRNLFAALVAADDEAAEGSTRQTFNARGLQASTVERQAQMQLQPIYQLSYYTADGAPTVYDREVEELNAARVLPFVVFMTNSLPQLTRDAESARHFESVSRLTALIDRGEAKPIDRFARAMDFMTLKDYERALTDLDAVVAAQPLFAPAFLMRAAARYRLREAQQGRVLVEVDAAILNAEAAMALEQIMGDLDRALELNPRMAVAHYNRGIFLMELGADADALDAFSRAIHIDPELGPAYFNRGFIQFSRGNRPEAAADLSRAGQLGVAAAYPLLRQLR